MSIKAVLLSLGLGIILIGSVFFPEGDPKPKESIILSAIMKVQEQAHYKGADINDEFSKKVYDLYVKSLDYNKRFLTSQDLAQLSQYETLIDDHLKTNNLEFFEKSLKIIDAGVDKSKSWYPEILKSSFTYDDDEYFETDRDDRLFLPSNIELKEFWRKMLKYETVIKLNRKMVKQKKLQEKAEDELTDKEKELLSKSFTEIEEDAREDVEDVFDKWFDRMDDIRRSDRFEQFVNSITQVLDPHTTYFNPKEKEDFDINMSGRLEGIGARLQTEDDLTKVVAIIAGGPAWKQRELEVDDYIVAVKQENSDVTEDLTGMRIDDVVKRIRGKKGTKVTLTILKKNGTEELITIVRDEVIIDEGFAKSLIIDHDEIAPKVGYIYLPRFYSNFNSKNGPKASRDIKGQLEKLKEESVDGIILDLRGNGGGSLQEVVEISGLFIEEGPIVQVKGRRGNPYIHRDNDGSVTYGGPLIVMVNAYSASASEILAAALQDYDRAVIVGSPQTFGKGTVQRFIDLDRAVSGMSELKPLGQVKVTTQKYYRINGGSVQLRGVHPDIVLPDKFTYIETGEQDYDHALPWTQIEGVPHDQDVYASPDMKSLKMKSLSRIDGDPLFLKIDDNAKRIKESREDSKRPLNLTKYSSVIEERKKVSDDFDDLFQPIEEMHLENPILDMEYINADSSRIARNDKWKERLSKDVHLQETLYIISDMMSTKRP